MRRFLLFPDSSSVRGAPGKYRLSGIAGPALLRHSGPQAGSSDLTVMPNGSPFGSNGDDRRQRRKQGGAVGAAASRMRAAAKQTLGAATRAVSPKVTEREAICPKNLSKFWKINLKAFSHKSGKLCYNHNYGRGRGCAALTENNEEGGEPYGTVPLQALWCDQKRR